MIKNNIRSIFLFFCFACFNSFNNYFAGDVHVGEGESIAEESQTGQSGEAVPNNPKGASNNNVKLAAAGVGGMAAGGGTFYTYNTFAKEEQSGGSPVEITDDAAINKAKSMIAGANDKAGRSAVIEKILDGSRIKNSSEPEGDMNFIDVGGDETYKSDETKITSAQTKQGNAERKEQEVRKILEAFVDAAKEVDSNISSDDADSGKLKTGIAALKDEKADAEKATNDVLAAVGTETGETVDGSDAVKSAIDTFKEKKLLELLKELSAKFAGETKGGTAPTTSSDMKTAVVKKIEVLVKQGESLEEIVGECTEIVDSSLTVDRDGIGALIKRKYDEQSAKNKKQEGIIKRVNRAAGVTQTNDDTDAYTAVFTDSGAALIEKVSKQEKGDKRSTMLEAAFAETGLAGFNAVKDESAVKGLIAKWKAGEGINTDEGGATLSAFVNELNGVLGLEGDSVVKLESTTSGETSEGKADREGRNQEKLETLAGKLKTRMKEVDESETDLSYLKDLESFFNGIDAGLFDTMKAAHSKAGSTDGGKKDAVSTAAYGGLQTKVTTMIKKTFTEMNVSSAKEEGSSSDSGHNGGSEDNASKSENDKDGRDAFDSGLIGSVSDGIAERDTKIDGLVEALQKAWSGKIVEGTTAVNDKRAFEVADGLRKADIEIVKGSLEKVYGEYGVEKGDIVSVPLQAYLDNGGVRAAGEDEVKTLAAGLHKADIPHAFEGLTTATGELNGWGTGQQEAGNLKIEGASGGGQSIGDAVKEILTAISGLKTTGAGAEETITKLMKKDGIDLLTGSIGAIAAKIDALTTALAPVKGKQETIVTGDASEDEKPAAQAAIEGIVALGRILGAAKGALDGVCPEIDELKTKYERQLTDWNKELGEFCSDRKKLFDSASRAYRTASELRIELFVEAVAGASAAVTDAVKTGGKVEDAGAELIALRDDGEESKGLSEETRHAIFDYVEDACRSFTVNSWKRVLKGLESSKEAGGQDERGDVVLWKKGVFDTIMKGMENKTANDGARGGDLMEDFRTIETKVIATIEEAASAGSKSFTLTLMRNTIRNIMGAHNSTKGDSAALGEYVAGISEEDFNGVVKEYEEKQKAQLALQERLGTEINGELGRPKTELNTYFANAAWLFSEAGQGAIKKAFCEGGDDAAFSTGNKSFTSKYMGNAAGNTISEIFQRGSENKKLHYVIAGVSFTVKRDDRDKPWYVIIEGVKDQRGVSLVAQWDSRTCGMKTMVEKPQDLIDLARSSFKLYYEEYSYCPSADGLKGRYDGEVGRVTAALDEINVTVDAVKGGLDPFSQSAITALKCDTRDAGGIAPFFEKRLVEDGLLTERTPVELGKLCSVPISVRREGESILVAAGAEGEFCSSFATGEKTVRDLLVHIKGNCEMAIYRAQRSALYATEKEEYEQKEYMLYAVREAAAAKKTVVAEPAKDATVKEAATDKAAEDTGAKLTDAENAAGNGGDKQGNTAK